jgi:hypothetical protein
MMEAKKIFSSPKPLATVSPAAFNPSNAETLKFKKQPYTYGYYRENDLARIIHESL